MISPKSRIISICTRQDFAAEHQRRLDEICASVSLDWSRVLAAGIAHGVGPLIFSNLRKSRVAVAAIPKQIAQEMRECIFENVAVKQLAATETASILQRLAKIGIKVMLVKGAVLDLQVYAAPWLTQSEDVDLVLQIQPQDAQRAHVQSVLNYIHRLNAAHVGPQQHIEYDFFAHHDVTINDVLRIDFKHFWESARQTEWSGQPVWVMSPEDQLLAAAINSCRKRYVKMKSLCDIAEIAATYKELDWEKVGWRASMFGCERILFCAMYLSQKSLGAKFPSDWVTVIVGKKPRVLTAISDRMLADDMFAKYLENRSRQILNRQLSPLLLLTYASYTPGQRFRKLGEIWHARSKSD